MLPFQGEPGAKDPFAPVEALRQLLLKPLVIVP
jgi:hypothetical protein